MKPTANRDGVRRTDVFLPQLVNDNREALEELFSRYRGRLYNTAFRVLRNPEDAEDALQDGLLSAFRKLDTFEGRSQFSTWLTRIVFNAAAMQMRRRRPEVVTSIDDQPGSGQEPWAHRIPDDRTNPEEIYAQQERRQIVRQCLQSLPPPCRHAMRLCIVQGLNIREASEALGIPIGTLKYHLHRAKLRFRERAAVASPWQGRLLRGCGAISTTIG
ncbi:MAG: sigma-70 family RNA polymerase sigma factor [Terriglobia bacterium]|jgi:RNA polymerase sigma-70 factor (ECF subfamily)